MEDINISNAYQLKQIKQWVGKENFPDFSEEQFTLARRGLEIWMCTVGAAISPNRKKEVSYVWQKLISAKHMLPEALEELKRREKQTKELLDSHLPSFFEFIKIDELQEMCRFAPAAFN